MSDDSDGGDTNGDGSDSRSGSAGDWVGVLVDASGAATLDHAKVSFGSFGVQTNYSLAMVTLTANTFIHRAAADVVVCHTASVAM